MISQGFEKYMQMHRPYFEHAPLSSRAHRSTQWCGADPGPRPIRTGVGRSRMSTASLRAAAHYGMTEGRRFRPKASCSNGEGDLRSPAPEDLAALTVEAAAMAGCRWRG